MRRLFSWAGRGYRDEGQLLRASTRLAITRAQESGQDVIFHGTCVSCLHRRGNASGEGMRYCLGCAVSQWEDFGENRYLPSATEADCPEDFYYRIK